VKPEHELLSPELFNGVSPGFETRSVFADDSEVVHVSDVEWHAQLALDELIQRIKIEIGEKLAGNLADFLPVYGPREGDSDPVVIFRNRLGGLVGYNGFDSGLPNYSSLVTGSSGGGKSFLNNCILLQEFARGLRVFIIDIGGSYKKLTEALGGQYLEVSLSDQYRINPFDIPNPKEEPSNQKIKSLLAVIESMVAEDERSKLPKLDRALLEKALIELYKSRRAKGEVPTLSDLARYLSAFEEESMRAISKMLYLWTGERPYGRMLDGHGSLRTSAEICTFDLKGLSNYPDLQSVMILILTDFILAQVSNEKTRKARIIIDEAWELLKSSAAANFMEFCVRTLRKMGAGSGITFITQGVEEIVASPIGPAILNNTATKFVMLPQFTEATSKLGDGLAKLLPEFLALSVLTKDSRGDPAVTPLGLADGSFFQLKDYHLVRTSNDPITFVVCHRLQCGGLSDPLTKNEISMHDTQYHDSPWFSGSGVGRHWREVSTSVSALGAESAPNNTLADTVVETGMQLGSIAGALSKERYLSVPESDRPSVCKAAGAPERCFDPPKVATDRSLKLEGLARGAASLICKDAPMRGASGTGCVNWTNASSFSSGVGKARWEDAMATWIFLNLTVKTSKKIEKEWTITQVDFDPTSFCKYARPRSDFVTH
jgi:hypothetical protein